MKKITVFLNAYSQGISGADKICIETWKRIPGHAVTCITSQNGKKMCEQLEFNCNFKITTTESEFRNPILTYLKRIFLGIWIAIISPKQDILYSSSDQLPDILPAFVMHLKNSHAKWIVRSYHKIPLSRRISHIAQKLSWFIMSRFSATIITASSVMEKELLQYGFPSENIHIVYPGIIKVKISIKQRILKPYDAVFVSRLHESKGILELINIWKNVTQEFPHATLGIIGTGDTQIVQKLHEKMKKHNLTKSISLLGYLSDKEVAHYVSSSKVFIFPSHEEGFSLTIAEVLFLGTPIVTYDLPIFQDIFPDAFIPVPCFNSKMFSNKVIDVLGSPKKYQETLALGKKINKKYSWKNAIEKERIILDL